MQIIKVRFLIRLAAETAALPGKPEALGGSFRGTLAAAVSVVGVLN